MPWRDLLFRNLWWKLLAFALAVMIWSGAQRLDDPPLANPLQGPDDRVTLEIPIRVLGWPGEVRPVRLDPPAARLEIEGQPSVIRRLRPEDLLVFVELNNSSTTAPVEIRTPRGVKVVDLHPPRAILHPLLSSN